MRRAVKRCSKCLRIFSRDSCESRSKAPIAPSSSSTIEQQIANMARAGLIGATQVDQMTQVIRQAGQPMSMRYLRGELSRNPRNPSAQTYIPVFQTGAGKSLRERV
jgi:hypothetical protein